MPIIDSCCCWDSLKTGAIASAIFTSFTAVINFCIGIWMLVTLFWLENNLEWNEKITWLPPGCLILIFIEEAANITMFFLGGALLIGLSRGYGGRSFIWTWVYGVCFFRFYEACLAVYALVYIGSHRIGDIVYLAPEVTTIAIWWFINTFIMVAAVICVISYWQQLITQLFGKQHRIKYYQMLANVRSAGLSSYAGGPGSATPGGRGGYYASRSTLAASQASLGPPTGAAPGYPQKY